MLDFLTLLAWSTPPGNGQEGGGASSLVSTFVMFGLIFAIFYFMVMRPQQKRAKEHQSLISSVRRGDKVVMQGGVHGIVQDVKDTTITVEIAPRMVVTYEKGSVQNVQREETTETDS